MLCLWENLRQPNWQARCPQGLLLVRSIAKGERKNRALLHLPHRRSLSSRLMPLETLSPRPIRLANPNSAGSVLHLAPSDGHGAWQRDGTQFKTTFRKLLFDPTGAYIGNADLNESLTVGQPDQLSGSFTVTLSFLNGSPSLCSSGTVARQRMTVN